MIIMKWRVRTEKQIALETLECLQSIELYDDENGIVRRKYAIELTDEELLG